MSLKGDIERADCAIFADTGEEPEAVYAHLNRLLAYCREQDFPLHIVKRKGSKGIAEDVLHHIDQYHKGGDKWTRVGQPPLYVVNENPTYTDADGVTRPTDGSPGTLRRQCTREYKIEPIQQKIRELLGYKPRQRVKEMVEQWMGITVDEAQRMKDSGVKWITNKYPLVELRMNRHNCQKWLSRNWQHPVGKSACTFCPFHSNAQWRDLKVNQPGEFAAAVEFDRKLRLQPYPGAIGTPYIHRSGKPLSEVDLRNAEDRGQMTFLDECEGMCGV